jgi:hypothetical protein
MSSNINQDNAFAYIKQVGDNTFQLLRHHNLDRVKDGTEHDTVDRQLLIAALNTVDIVPFHSKEEREKAKKHLEDHAEALGVLTYPSATRVETKEDEERQINQQSGSNPGDPTHSDADEGDVLDIPFEPIKPPKDPDPEPKVKAQDLSEGAPLTRKAINDLPDSSFAVVEKGGKKNGESKTVPRNFRHLPFKKADGSIDLPRLRNALARMNQIKSVSSKDNTSRIRKAARKVLVSAARKHLPGSKFAQSQEIELGNVIMNTDGKIGIIKEVAQDGDNLSTIVRFADKSENIEFIENFSVLMHSDTDSDVEEIIIDPDMLTDEGKIYLNEQVIAAICGKVEAKLLGVEKLASRELLELRIGENKDDEFPMRIFVEVAKDSEDKTTAVRFLNEALPVSVLKDFADFLKSLTK